MLDRNVAGVLYLKPLLALPTIANLSKDGCFNVFSFEAKYLTFHYELRSGKRTN